LLSHPHGVREVAGSVCRSNFHAALTDDGNGHPMQGLITQREGGKKQLTNGREAK